MRPVFLPSLAVFVAVLATAPLAACTHLLAPGQHHTIGSRQAERAPRIVLTKQGTKHWDRPGAFGPVPEALVHAGQAQCATLNQGGKTYFPLGYHAHAETADGYPFEDGGFFCQRD